MKNIVASIFLILAIASIGYGFTIKLINSGSSFYVTWFLIGIVLLLVAVGVYAGVWGKMPAIARRIVIGVIALLAVGFVSIQALIMTEFNAHVDKDIDYIIVLGAKVRPDGSPSAVLKYRLDAAYDYLVEHPRTQCVVSGGQGSNEPMPEADAMADYLRERGIDEERILIENTSETTAENMDFSRELIANPSAEIGIVTNNFHVYRAVKIARKAGLEHVYGIAAHSDTWYLPNNMFRETFGILKNVVSGKM
ncbi:MAG: YdcF family protein [Actinomycetaceae bacterium]|nr:YdcF family protein [Actinomycetaceae bacterium]